MTDPLTDLIVSCRALIATLGPALDLLEELASGVEHGTNATRPLPLTGSGNKTQDVPAYRSVPLAA